LVVDAGSGFTPQPVPTSTSGIPLVQPTNVPTLGATIVVVSTPIPVTTPNMGPTAASGIPERTICDPTTAGRCQNITAGGSGMVQLTNGTSGLETGSPTDNGSQSGTTLYVSAFCLAYNGSTADRCRKDTYAAGPMWFSDGGSATAAIAAGAGPNVIKGTPGRLTGILITVAGSTGNDTFYDNASACSGTILAIADGTTALATAIAGYVVPINKFVAANGITECGTSLSPAVTVGYF
jgi:hypothetical protein